MARIFKDLKILYDGYNLSCKSNALTVNYEVEEKDQTTFCDDTVLSYPGLFKVNAELSGFMDLGALASGAVEALIDNEIGSTTPKLFTATSSNVAGEYGFFFEAFMIGSPYLRGGVGDLHEFDMRLANGRTSSTTSGRLVRGVIMKTLAAETGATGASTAIQIGAVPSGSTLYCGMHVIATDATSIDFDLRSDDNSGMTTPTVEDSFTTVTGVTSEMLAVPGAVTNDYWDISWTRTGGSTFTALFIAGILVD